MWIPSRAATRAQRTPSVHSVGSVHSVAPVPTPVQTKPAAVPENMNRSATSVPAKINTSSIKDNRTDAGRQELSPVTLTWKEEQQGLTLEWKEEQLRNAPKPQKVEPTWKDEQQQVKLTWKEEQQHAVPARDDVIVELVKEIRPSSDAPMSFPVTVHKTRWDSLADDDTTSRSSTLDGEDDYMEAMEKKPIHKLYTRKEARSEEPYSPVSAPHKPGPLEAQLAALMSKLIYLEHANPVVSVSPEEHEELQRRVKALEEEKKTWWKRHEAIWALRDEDVENNIKIRGLLAQTRRELEATKLLRDEDLANVHIVRQKLAEKTRELDRLQGQNGRVSPHRGRPASYLERRGTSDLFIAAKTAALEQRTLDLEKRNSDLVAQVETLKGGASIDDLNRFTAHQAWKETVGDLEAKLKAKDAEVARARSGSVSTGGGIDWYRVEALLEEHASYREAMGGKLQGLRSDKESLQRELHRKENECHVLELRLQSIQRRSTVL